ncbi:DUF3572 domain-containing protein [Sulfitobacter sp. SK012]|uniref:DUF3572 domain-containing protein n=1 Tax=Sulfitobacter sp. SK012 TaxID=1389005 RepID=UPI000E0AC593|nr:DUF3572 domain-containing protein [Sulfitobacter sp. SK012]AXI45912.1 DUF3572 domain-containing protein [Sulfitobacter sp. SK012]
MEYTRESAEVLALQALTWLVGNDELWPVFQGSSGASQEDLRKSAGDPAFLIGVLDFLMMDDAWVISFCDSVTVPYERVFEARQMLPGGAQVHWT